MNKLDIKRTLAVAGIAIQWGKGLENPHKLTASTGESVRMPAKSLNMANTMARATPAGITLQLLNNLLTQYPHLQQHDAVMQARLNMLEGVRYE